MKMRAFVAFALVLTLLGASAYTGRAYASPAPMTVEDTCVLPIDPTREDTLRLEAMSVAEDHGLRPDGVAVPLLRALPITLTRPQAPALGSAGEWKITYNADYGTPQSGMFMIMTKDWTNDYSVLYKKEWKDGAAPKSFRSCEFVTGGEYKLYVWIHFSKNEEGEGYDASDVFTLRDDGTHISLAGQTQKVVQECAADSQWQTALNLHDWLTHNACYDRNYEFYGADGVLLRGRGTCDSFSRAYLLLCREAGIPVSRVEGNAGGYHAWNAIRLGGLWYYVDVTWDDPLSSTAGDFSPVSGKERYDYFCLNEALLKIDHTNDGQFFTGECSSLNANYFIHSGEWKNWGADYSNQGGIWRANPFYLAAETAIDSGEAGWSVAPQYVWKNTDNSVAGWQVTERDMGIVSWGIAHMPHELAGGGSVRIASAYTPTGVSAKLKGWERQAAGVLKLPRSLTLVAEQAFPGISAGTVRIPAACREIGPRAFADSAVTTAYVPGSAALTIADDAFAGCSRILFVTGNAAVIAYAKAHHQLVAEPE